MTNGPVFIVGCPRSGNTLVSCILNKHPDFFILLEGNLFSGRYIRWHRSVSDGQSPRGAFLDATASFLRSRFGLSGGDVVDRLPENGSWSTLLDALLTACIDRFKPSAQVWGDKTPQNVAYLPTIQEQYPDARFIFVHRDPRHVVNSLSKPAFYLASDSPVSNAEVVDHYLNVYLRQRRAVDSSSVFELRYQDLIREPEPVMRRLCSFLNVEYTHRLLEAADEETRKLFGWPDLKAWEPIEPQPSSRLPESTEAVEAYLYDWIRRLDYEPTLPGTRASVLRPFVRLRLAPRRVFRYTLARAYRWRYPAAASYMNPRFPDPSTMVRWVRKVLGPTSFLLSSAGRR